MKPALFVAVLTLPLHAGTPPAGTPVDESLSAFRLFDGLQRYDADVELLTGGGISSFRSSAGYEQKRDDWTFIAGTALSSIAIDYEPCRSADFQPWVLEASGDPGALVPWTPGEANITIVTAGDIDTIRVRLPAAARWFVRLRVAR